LARARPHFPDDLNFREMNPGSDRAFSMIFCRVLSLVR